MIGRDESNPTMLHEYRQALFEELRKAAARYTPVRITDPSTSIPVIYGRRRTPGIVIETPFAVWINGANRIEQKVPFILLSEGEIDSIKRYYVDGIPASDFVENSIKKFGLFYRVGTIGLDDQETQAELNADPTTQLRTQNTDFRSAGEIPYSFCAYVVFQADIANPELPETPDAIDVKGVKLQLYTAAGATDGAIQWSPNGFWQFVDMVTATRYGLGLASTVFDFSVTKPEADIAGAAIESTEADTKVATAQASASTQCIVDSTEGFVAGRDTFVNGVANTCENVVSDVELVLGTAVTQAVDDRVVQKPLRWESNIIFDTQKEFASQAKEILRGVMGFTTYDDGKIQLRVERAHCTEHFTDGGLESWASPTDLDEWVEVTIGGSVNRDGADQYAGTYCARLDRTTTGALTIRQNFTGLEPGQFYLVSVRAKSSAAMTSGLSLRIFNATTSEYVSSDGYSWGAGVEEAIEGDTTTSYQRFTVLFKTHEDHTTTDDYWFTWRHFSSDTESLFLDALTMRGPFAGHFSDVDPANGMEMLEGSFRWILPDDKIAETNQVEIGFINDGGDVGPDIAVANDFEHQRTHPVRQHRINLKNVIDRNQAQRLADIALARRRTLGPGCAFSAGRASLAAQVGDVILCTATVPDWTEKELRITKKRMHCLGSQNELLSKLTCEDYQESIYTDTGATARGLRTRPSPTVTVTIDESTFKRVVATVALSTDGWNARKFFLYASTTSGFTPTPHTLVKKSNGAEITWNPPDTYLGQTLYFVAQVITDRGALESAEVSAEITGAVFDDTDPTVTEDTSPFNLVYDGDFNDDAAWESNSNTTQTVRDADGSSNGSETNQFGSRSNAQDSNDGTESTGTAAVTWSSGVPTISNVESLWTFTGYSSSGRNGRFKAKVRCGASDGRNGSVKVYYRDNGGPWILMGSNTTTSNATIVSGDVSGIDLSTAEIRVYGQPYVDFFDQDGQSHTHVVVDCWFEEDTAGTITASVSGGVATLSGNDTAATTAVLARQLPGNGDPNELANSVLLSSGDSLVVRLRCRHLGAAPDEDVKVVLVDTSGALADQTLLTIPQADIESDWNDWAALYTAGTEIAGMFEVQVQYESSNTVQVNQLGVFPGKRLTAYTLSVEEIVAGLSPDRSDGSTDSFPAGPWGATAKKASVS